MMLNKVRRCIQRHHMAEPYEPLWVAVSGGVDSMVLLHVLQRLYHTCNVVHVDHGLRGAESDADRLFVEAYFEKHRLPFRSERVDVRSMSKARKISTQMAARELRYELFRKLAQEGPKKLALAHHQDDAIETLFIQMMQGMGLNGWRTIPPVAGPFIRPLMDTSREEILAYAEEHGIEYREDASNSDRKYLRNRIRNELLPMLETWRPGVRRSLSRSVDLFREMDHVTQQHLQKMVDREREAFVDQRIPFREILDHGTPRLVLHHLLRHHGFHPDRLDDILYAVEEGNTGATFSDGGLVVTVDREALIIEVAADEQRSWSIEDLGQLPEDLPFTIEMMEPDKIDLITGYRTAWLDLDRLTLPLEFRPWREGDRMRPIGLKGRKLISDMLIDAKVPRNEKSRVHVLTSAGEVVWLAGYRVAEGFEARADSRVVARFGLRAESTGEAPPDRREVLR